MTDSDQDERLVSYDPDASLATIIGPGGFTQIRTSQIQAEGIATVLGIRFEIKAWVSA